MFNSNYSLAFIGSFFFILSFNSSRIHYNSSDFRDSWIKNSSVKIFLQRFFRYWKSPNQSSHSFLKFWRRFPDFGFLSFPLVFLAVILGFLKPLKFLAIILDSQGVLAVSSRLESSSDSFAILKYSFKTKRVVCQHVGLCDRWSRFIHVSCFISFYFIFFKSFTIEITLQ